MKNSITDTENTPEVISSRSEYAKEWISDLEDRVMEASQAEQHTEKRIKKMRIG